jgi:hypothetical protein
MLSKRKQLEEAMDKAVKQAPERFFYGAQPPRIEWTFPSMAYVVLVTAASVVVEMWTLVSIG